MVRAAHAARVSRVSRAVLAAAVATILGAGLIPDAQADGDPVTRSVLVELVGSMDCAACPGAREALAALEAEWSDRRIVTLELHGASPLANGVTDARRAAYGDPPIPSVILDGGPAILGGGDWDAVLRPPFEARIATPTPIAIEALYAWDLEARLGEISLDLQVTEGDSIPAGGGWTVRAFVVEDAVAACCGTGGRDRWDRIVRRALPEEPLGLTSGGSGRRIDYALALDPAWNLDRLGAVVVLQQDGSGEVLNAARAIDALSLQPVPADPVDNSRARLLPIVPNPLRTESRIAFTLPADAQAAVTIHDGAGRVVRVLTDGPRPDGLHPLFWDATDWRGQRLASGVYFVRLATSRGEDTAKLVVLH